MSVLQPGVEPSHSRTGRWSTSLRLAVAASLALACTLVHAVEVAYTGSLGSRALLVIQGQARTVPVGATVQGVRLVSMDGQEAVIEVAGQRHTLRLGASPVSLGDPEGGARIVLTAGHNGHFFTPGRINNREVRFMVDTGASMVALGAADAQRLGLDYKGGRPVRVNTANGPTQGYVVTLTSLRIADVEVYNVQAIVTAADMPWALLGNSYLSRFQMRRDNDQMVLTRRY